MQATRSRRAASANLEPSPNEYREQNTQRAGQPIATLHRDAQIRDSRGAPIPLSKLNEESMARPCVTSRSRWRKYV
jgi:hypothetical protein